MDLARWEDLNRSLQRIDAVHDNRDVDSGGLVVRENPTLHTLYTTVRRQGVGV
jgi:hypothetical protein